MSQVVVPYGQIPFWQKVTVALGWIVLTCVVWVYPPDFLYFIPSPSAVLAKFDFLYSMGLLDDLLASLKVIFWAAAIALPVGCILSYLYESWLFKPPIVMIAGLSNLGPAAVLATCLYMGFSGMEVKIYTMAFVILVFFLSSLIQNRPTQSELDLAKTMNMGPWQALWHVTIRGKQYDTLKVFIPNLAMGWAMLAVVESASRSDGGLGDVLLKQDKISSMAGIAAVSIVALIFGLLIRYGLSALLDWLLPTTSKTTVGG